MFRAENDVRGVVFLPIALQQTAFRFHLPKQRRAGIWRENVKSGALHPVRFDPLHECGERVLAVVIEAHHETAVYLNAVLVKEADAPGVILRARRAFAGVHEILVGERLEADKYAGAASQRHLPHQRGILRDIERNRRAPDSFERT